MIRTAILLSSIILFVTWYIHVINRASKGFGFRRNELPGDVAYSGMAAGGLFVLIVSWALAGVSAWHVRGREVSAIRVLGPPLLIWTACCVVAFLLGVALAEGYCALEESVFRRQRKRHLTKASRASLDHAQAIYSRRRWWPATRERLESSETGARTTK